MRRESYSLFSKRPALIALIFYIAGIFIPSFIIVSYIFPLILTLALLILLIFAYANKSTQTAAVILAILLTSLGWYLTQLVSGPFPVNHISNFTNGENRVELVGRVVDEPDYRPEKTYLVIETDSIKLNDIWIPAFGRLRASIRDRFPCAYSDCLLLKGYLLEPSGARNPGGFDYKAYLKSKEIYATLSVGDSRNLEVLRRGNSLISSVVSPLRQKILNLYNNSLSINSAALLSGFLLGERGEISNSTEELFRKTGTLHLMAVSGSNVALIIAIFAFPLTFMRIPRPIKASILLGIVLFFAILTRLEPSVIRASIMAAVGLVAYGWMRKPDYINLLAFAGFLMLLVHPLEIYDVGLQLSFAAAFGIIFALPHFGAILGKLSGKVTRYIGYLATAILTTLAAQIAVLPLMIHYFRNLPAAGALANLPVALLAAVANIGGIVLLFGNFVSGWLGKLIAIPLGKILELTVSCLQFFASLPKANIKTPSISWGIMTLIWLCCYLMFIFIVNRRISKRAMVVILVVLNFQIWIGLLTRQPEWRLEFLDLGRNHAWVYSERDGYVLARYDAYIEQDDADDVLIPYLLDNCKSKLDFLITSTPDSPEIIKLIQEFEARVFAKSNALNINLRDTTTDWDSTRSAVLCNFHAAIKIIWELSDNRHGQVNSNPAAEISIGGGTILLSDWTGAEIVRILENHRLRLLEMPWSVYAQSKTLDAISQSDPEFMIFSPDQYSNRMPYNRAQLTHSRDRVLATSICGAIEVTGSDSTITARTMKLIGP
jgi:competence protein ComEC